MKKNCFGATLKSIKLHTCGSNFQILISYFDSTGKFT